MFVCFQYQFIKKPSVADKNHAVFLDGPRGILKAKYLFSECFLIFVFGTTMVKKKDSVSS